MRTHGCRCSPRISWNSPGAAESAAGKVVGRTLAEAGLEPLLPVDLADLVGPEDRRGRPLDQVDRPLDQEDLEGREDHCPDLLGDRPRHWDRSVRSVVLPRRPDDRPKDWAVARDDPEPENDRPENDRPDRLPLPRPERPDLGPERGRLPLPLLLERERLLPRDGARERLKGSEPPRWVVRTPRGGPVDWPVEPRSPRS